MSDERRISVYDGKYEFVVNPGDHWAVSVLRHGEPWLVIQKGHKAVMQLVDTAIDARAEAKRYRTALRNVRSLATRMKKKLGRDADMIDVLDFMQEAPDHLLRFCEDAGIKAEILREEA